MQRKLNKFENVDVVASLREIMEQNTAFYQSDFEIDKDIIAKAAASEHKEDKFLLWLCRPSGTHCFKEHDVFLKDTMAHNTWCFYGEQANDRILAYAVDLKGEECEKIIGSLYELDYGEHCRRVRSRAVDASRTKLAYEHGEREIPAGKYFDGGSDPEFGKFECFEPLPDDPGALRHLLMEERRSRERLILGDFKTHIAALRYGLAESEAYRIVEGMKKYSKPNSPDGVHFMVELSPVFVRLASAEDMKHLRTLLPYKTLHLSALEDRRGIYALVGMEENRNKRVQIRHYRNKPIITEGEMKN